MAKPRPMTKQALLSAFGGESMAHMRYLFFAETAEREGLSNVARLFRAIAYAEQVHAGNHYNRLREFDEDVDIYAGTPIGPGNTSKNLSLAIRGEEFEVNEMYPAYIAIEESQGEKAGDCGWACPGNGTAEWSRPNLAMAVMPGNCRCPWSCPRVPDTPSQ